MNGSTSWTTGLRSAAEEVKKWLRKGKRRSTGNEDITTSGGGGVRWRGLLCVFGGFLIQLALGSYYSFANMMPYMASYMRHNTGSDLTYADFIVVHSAWGFTQGCVLPIGGALVAAVGTGAAVTVGSILFSVAPIVTAFTISSGSLWSVVLSFGVLSSVGQNLAILPTLTIPMAWFPERKGLVSGVVVSGFGAGAFAFNQIQLLLANPSGLSASQSGPDQGYFVDTDILDRVPVLLIVCGVIYGCILTVGALLLLLLQNRDSEGHSAAQEAAGNEERRGEIDVLSAVKSILTRREFYLLWIARFGVLLLSQAISGFYKAFGLGELAYGDGFLATVGSVAAVFNCFGRMLFGYLVDRVSYRTLTLITTAVSAALLSTFPALSEHLGQPAFAVSLWLMFFSFTSVYAMHPAVCSQIFGAKLDHIAIGMVGSSDIASNLLVGGFSESLLAEVGWEGYFPCVAAASAVTVIAATALFPNYQDGIADRRLSMMNLTEAEERNRDAGQKA